MDYAVFLKGGGLSWHHISSFPHAHPPSLSHQSPAASDYSMFVQAMASLQPPMDYVAFLNGAVGMANGITILAPSNAAFQVTTACW
ncbi:unnamed protein product [Closterium sp. NIES-54]